jgi:hypothetical protein
VAISNGPLGDSAVMRTAASFRSSSYTSGSNSATALRSPADASSNIVTSDIAELS